MGLDMANFLIVTGAVLIVAGVVTAVFFLLSLQRALERCAPENRTLAPGKVWLCLIPLYGLVWIFVVVSRIADSLRREFQSRHAAPEDYGRTVGLAYCILATISIIPFVDLLTGPAAFACWMIYWVKISGYSRALEQKGAVPAGVPAQEFPEAEGPFNPRHAWLALAILMLGFAAQHLQVLNFSWFARALKDQFMLTSSEFGGIFSAYLLGLIAGSILMTVVTALWGTRWGLAVALAGVSLAAAGGGLASGAGGMMVTRALLGFFTGGLLPAAIQSLREYFPARIRPLAIGLFLASAPLIALLLWPLGRHITGLVSWRTASMITGIPTALAAVLCGIAWRSPSPRGRFRGVSTLAVASVTMLGVGLLLAAPLYVFAQAWLPNIAMLRGLGGRWTALPAINLSAGAGGAILAGVAAWAWMRAGATAWKTRAGLLTVFGLILPAAALLGIFSPGWMLLVVSALIMGAFAGWTTLLYAAVADTLPAQGVAIAVAIGAFMLALGSALTNPALASLMMERGYGSAFGVPAVVAAGGLVCVGLLAWLIRPQPSLLPTSDSVVPMAPETIERRTFDLSQGPYAFPGQSVSSLVGSLKATLPGQMVVALNKRAKSPVIQIRDGRWRGASLFMDDTHQPVSLVRIVYNIPSAAAKLLVYIATCLALSIVFTAVASAIAGKFMPVASAGGIVGVGLAMSIQKMIARGLLSSPWATGLKEAIERANTSHGAEGTPKDDLSQAS